MSCGRLARGPRQTVTHARRPQMENQIIRSQAGYVDAGIPPGERIVEIVRQKYGFQL